MGITKAMLIYKIFRSGEWADLQAKGETAGAPVDLADGFVHFSTAKQVAETAARHFAGEEDLYLLAVSAESLGDDLKWEASRDGQDFPHLYRNLLMDDLIWHWPIPVDEGFHQFPEDLE